MATVRRLGHARTVPGNDGEGPPILAGGYIEGDPIARQALDAATA